MDSTILKFNEKKHLLDFYSCLENTPCTIDLRELTLASTFSEEEVAIAVRKYSVRILQEESIY